jgi:hypothetical protein
MQSEGCSCAEKILALVPFESRFNVLHNANHSVTSHVLIRFSVEIISDAFSYLVGQTGTLRRLKERELIKFVIFVVNDNETFYFGMSLEPCEHLIATRPLWHVRNDIYERNAPVFSAEETCGIVTPRRR